MDKNQIQSLILVFSGVCLSIYFLKTVEPEHLDRALIFPGALVGAGLERWKK